MDSRSICVLEEKHMILIMMFLSANDGCKKSDIYRDVSTNPRMPEKLNRLESAGLIVQEPEPDSRAVRISLTDLGRKIAARLSDADSLMSDTNNL